MNLITTVLIILFLSYIIIYRYGSYNEKFVANLSIVDPFSLYLHNDISNKEDWWHKTHSNKFYYYRDMVPIYYKE